MTEAERRLFISLYTDADVSDLLAQLLRERGFEAASAAEWNGRQLGDEEQLALAADRGHALLTYNRDDFIYLARRWHEERREHAGIVISRQFSRKQTGELLRQVLRLLDTVSADEMWNTVRNLQSYRG